MPYTLENSWNMKSKENILISTVYNRILLQYALFDIISTALQKFESFE